MKDKKITKYLIFSLAGLIGLLIITRGITFAKYVSNSVLNYYLTSKGFYFTSEELDTIEKKNIDTSWDGESVKFTLTNSANNTLATEYDIKYKITCTIEEETENDTKQCYLNGTTSNEIEATLSTNTGCSNKSNDGVDVSTKNETQCIEDGYTWESVPSFAEISFEVVDTSGKEVSTATVLIKAQAIAPYKKELTAKYILNKDTSNLGALTVNYEEKNTYENVTVINSYNEDKCVKLSWDASKIVVNLEDELQYNTDDNNYINEIIFTLEKKNSKSFVFYKVNSKEELTSEDFILLESNECKDILQ